MDDRNEYFEKGVLALIGLIADPKAAAARLAELRQVAADNDKAAAKIAADRAEFAEYERSTRAEFEQERAKAARVWKLAEEKEFKAAGHMERAEAYAAKVGYFERPSSIPFGSGSGGMVLIDEAPAPPPPAAPAPEMVAESFEGGRSGGRMVARPHVRGRA